MLNNQPIQNFVSNNAATNSDNEMWKSHCVMPLRAHKILSLEKLNDLPLNTVKPNIVAIFVFFLEQNDLHGNRSETGSHFVFLRLLGGE